MADQPSQSKSKPCLKHKMAGEMVQLVRVLANKPHDMSLIPRTHVVGKN